jgi:cytoskeleton protein RodZ
MVADRSDDFGSRLRAARERKGISLRDIASRTKISIAVLEALERNDISRLPGGIFSRAFVRAYAHEVGLDAETAIQDFLAAFPHDSVIAALPRSGKVGDIEFFESDRRGASSVLWILAASVGLAAVVLYLSVARGGSMSQAQPGTAPLPAPPASGNSASSNVAVESAAATGSNVPAAAPRSGSPTETASAPASLPPPVGTGSSPANASAAAAGDRLTIALAARRPVWVSATVDGRKALGRLLQPGEQETIEVSREMVITAGDAAAIRMTLNGAEARPLGKTGEVVTARLTLANFKDYLVSR